MSQEVDDDGAIGGEKESYFTKDIDNVIKKYGFDPLLEKIPDEKEIKARIASLNGKGRSKNLLI